MALITEDGSIVAGAESLCDVTTADTYHAAWGNTAWAAIASTALKEQALRRATSYLQSRYRDRWAGTRKSTAQALDWPRYQVPIKDLPSALGQNLAYVSSTIVPPEVIRACAELALTASAGSALAPDLTRGILVEKVGDISVEYDPNSPQQTRYQAIDLMLKPLLKSGGGASTVGLSR